MKNVWTQDEYNEFREHMEKKYPKMFVNRYGGFACGPGWWPMIDKLCSLIQSHIDWNNNRAEQYPDMCYKTVPQVIISQVKEKFGTLRFYYDGGNDVISGMVSMAEEMSSIMCEECGEPGQLRKGGWLVTLCDIHEEQRQLRRSQQ